MAAEKRVAYDAEFKVKAIDYAKEHGNRPAARAFHINECMVRRWRQQEDELRLTRKTKKSFRGRKVRWPDVSTVTIRVKAKAIANQLHIEEFKAGASWCFRFMKRQQLSIRTWTTVCQQLPTDYKEKVATYLLTKTSTLSMHRKCGLYSVRLVVMNLLHTYCIESILYRSINLVLGHTPNLCIFSITFKFV
uniref:HTH CENPB-type domain-containing protein n=1 Tax=Catharus ustulatus TaxID=91951 RepID=A0A8C3U9Z3_CATUS